jgi:hypothetical protein
LLKLDSVREKEMKISKFQWFGEHIDFACKLKFKMEGRKKV